MSSSPRGSIGGGEGYVDIRSPCIALTQRPTGIRVAEHVSLLSSLTVHLRSPCHLRSMRRPARHAGPDGKPARS